MLGAGNINIAMEVPCKLDHRGEPCHSCFSGGL